MGLFSRQAKKIIHNNYCSSYFLTMDKLELLLWGQSCPSVPKQHLEVANYMLIPRLISKRDSPTPHPGVI